MANNKGVESIKRELQKTIVDYVETEYFGKTPLLRKRCDDELRFSSTLFQEPYFEATPSYEVSKGGACVLRDSAKRKRVFGVHGQRQTRCLRIPLFAPDRCAGSILAQERHPCLNGNGLW